MLNDYNPFKDILAVLQIILQRQDDIMSMLAEKNLQNGDDLLTTAQAKDYLKCSAPFLWRLRKDGKIKATNAGKKILYLKASLNQYLQIKKGGSK